MWTVWLHRRVEIYRFNALNATGKHGTFRRLKRLVPHTRQFRSNTMPKTRLFITGMLYPMINAIIFGSGAVAILSIPFLSANAPLTIPVAVAAAFIGAVPISWYLAPRMRYRYWRRRNEEPGFPLV